MLNANDLEQLKAKGISEKQIEEQLACFVKGFPYLEIAASASVNKGIMVIDKEAQASYMESTETYTKLFEDSAKYHAIMNALARELYREMRNGQGG